MDAYQAAHEQLKTHYGTSGRTALAKAVLSVYNGQVYGFSMGEILGPLDGHYTKLVMDMMIQYAAAGETQTLRDAGEYVRREMPGLVELAHAAYYAKQDLRAKWDREEEERIEREEAEEERQAAERRARRKYLRCLECNDSTLHEPRAMGSLWFCTECYTERQD